MDPRHDFVGDGSNLFRQFFGAYFRLALTSQENDLVIRLYINIGNVDSDHVHHHATHDRNGFASREDATAVGESSVIAVVVADGKNRDLHRICLLYTSPSPRDS